MVSQFAGRISSLMDIGNLLVNKIAVLSVVLLFFLAVLCLNAFFKAGLSPSKVTSTIKIALLGFVLLLLEALFTGVPAYGEIVGNLQGLIVMYCLASLVTYLVVDGYLYYRMRKQVPSFQRDLLTVLVYVVFAMVSLRIIFRIDISSILTTTTVLTAAVAFAMQTTIANVFSGFQVQSDENLQRHTWITIKDPDITGEIVNVGFRYTTLRTLDNRRILVPNHYIMQNVVQNLGTRGGTEKTAVHLKVGLGYDLPPEKAVDLLSRILLQEEHVMKDPPPRVVVHDFLESSVEYDLKYFLEDYSFHLATRGSVLMKIWYAVAREGFSIPFPHREIISRTPREPFPVDREGLPAILRGTDILRSLGEDELRRLSERVRVKVYGTGEIVVRQNDEGDSLFLVRRGALGVSIDGAPVGSLREGEIFGEMSLLTGERRKATVAAASEVHLIEISKEDIQPVIRANPELLEKLSALLAQREERNIEQKKRAELSRAG
ncbi:MAG: mechanosensitive ion channel, partial [Deltaproteobacteria bacterium]|nr:mechanosensitive ion channel [Deltaproteobacteria bacterium]